MGNIQNEIIVGGILKSLGDVAYVEDYVAQHNFIKHLKLNSLIDNRKFWWQQYCIVNNKNLFL